MERSTAILERFKALYPREIDLSLDRMRILMEKLGERDVQLYHAYNHRKNWLECIRSRKETICPAEVGHRSATVCHLGNIGYWLRTPLQWGPVKERFVDNDEANKWVDRALREPWRL